MLGDHACTLMDHIQLYHRMGPKPTTYYQRGISPWDPADGALAPHSTLERAGLESMSHRAVGRDLVEIELWGETCLSGEGSRAATAVTQACDVGRAVQRGRKGGRAW